VNSGFKVQGSGFRDEFKVGFRDEFRVQA